MNFEYEGHVYEDVELTPSKTITCPWCHLPSTQTGVTKPMDPPIYLYKCEAKHELGIHSEYTRGHWPTKVLVAFNQWHDKWVADGCPIYEGIGYYVRYNPRIATISIDR